MLLRQLLLASTGVVRPARRAFSSKKAQALLKRRAKKTGYGLQCGEKVPYFSPFEQDFIGQEGEGEDDEEDYDADAAAVDPYFDDGWDEETNTWHGFDGDMQKTEVNGTPVWMAAAQNLMDPDPDREMREKALRRAQHEAKQVCTRVSIVDEDGRSYGTGRRKTSTARVWLQPGNTCEICVNGKPMAEYFNHDYMKEDILGPFVATSQIGTFNVRCTVQGGGISGQAGAIRHGISRALQNFNPAFRPALKKAGFLTRDPRMVERKKPGQPKARKKFQWVKR